MLVLPLVGLKQVVILSSIGLEVAVSSSYRLQAVIFSSKGLKTVAVLTPKSFWLGWVEVVVAATLVVLLDEDGGFPVVFDCSFKELLDDDSLGSTGFKELLDCGSPGFRELPFGSPGFKELHDGSFGNPDFILSFCRCGRGGGCGCLELEDG